MTTGRPARAFTAAELRRLRSAVEAGEETLEAIARRLKCSRHTVVALIVQHGWNNPARARQLPAKPKGGASYMANQAKYIAAKRAEVEEADRKLYGALLDDVQWLRRRGFAINVERGGYRVGNVVIDGAALVSKAARERRLANAGGA